MEQACVDKNAGLTDESKRRPAIMQLGRKLKKATALLSAGIILAGLITIMPQGTVSVKADDTQKTPSVSAYATKEQLMDDTFAPKNDGTADNYGKLVFGKNSNGAAQEWYILGKDNGVSGDNTMIFAAAPILSKTKFDAGNLTKMYTYASGEGYGTDPGTIEVLVNHYGASDLNSELKSIISNTSFFTGAESYMFNSTKIYTMDVISSVTYSGSNVNYSIQSMIYAPAKGTGGGTFITVGSDDSTELSMSAYWGSGDKFWLRSPVEGFVSSAYYAIPGSGFGNISVSNNKDIRPASNLNLSSVLFASAATAAATDTPAVGKIAQGTAMTLRLDGADKMTDIVIYDDIDGLILVKPDSSQDTAVSVMVQGKDGTDDWYYSEKITSEKTISLRDIKTAAGLSSDINPDECKIWIETIGADGMIYAKQAEEGTVIKNITLEINGPALGKVFDMSADIATSGVTVTDVVWKENGEPAPESAGYAAVYTVSVTVKPESDFFITAETEATVNSESAGITANGDGTFTVMYTFQATVDRLTHTHSGYVGEYDGTPHSISIEASVSDVTISYSTDEDEINEEDKYYDSYKPEFTEAGEYTVYYKLEKEGYETLYGSETVSISRHGIIIKADGQVINEGEEIADDAYSSTGVVDGDIIADVTLTVENGVIKVSNALILDSYGGDVTDSYEITYESGALRITAADSESDTGDPTPDAGDGGYSHIWFSVLFLSCFTVVYHYGRKTHIIEK